MLCARSRANRPKIADKASRLESVSNRLGSVFHKREADPSRFGPSGAMLDFEIRMAEHAKIPEKSGIAARAMQAIEGAPSPDYLNALNPEQRLAVETLDGPVLVLAGAGTGKTRVLTTRIAHILRLGRAHPSQILAVTFTNKAAREMKLRIGQMVGQMVEGMPWLGTFHAIGVKILRRHAELVGLKIEFHDPRRRRPDPADQTAPRSGERRRKEVASTHLRRDPRRLEEPRIDARPGSGRRRRWRLPTARARSSMLPIRRG